MSLYVLDTDIFSLYQHEHPAVCQAVGARRGEVAIAIISVEEQLSGWYALLRQARDSRDLARVYERFTKSVRALADLAVLSFTEAAILRYNQLKAMKLNVGKNDLRMAAISLEFGGILVTRNLRDFQRVPNLTVENWAA